MASPTKRLPARKRQELSALLRILESLRESPTDLTLVRERLQLHVDHLHQVELLALGVCLWRWRGRSATHAQKIATVIERGITRKCLRPRTALEQVLEDSVGRVLPRSLHAEQRRLWLRIARNP